MKAKIKNWLFFVFIAAGLLGSCTGNDANEQVGESESGVPANTSTNSESMDTGTKSDSIISTNSADGTDSGM